MILVGDVQALRRRATAFAGKWFAVEREVYNEDRQRIALARDPDTASYLADVHNAFLPMVNGWLMVRKALRDRKAMTKLLKEEAKK